ncbi:MAG: hypothetical protein IPO41_18195 [Acidobacteria bacterium]|nr:hypothetical protein [Acidobacteriota bacterium]
MTRRQVEGPATPPGMTGSNANDPRSKLTPGLWDASEASMGIKHISLLRKPDAFQLGIDPNSPKVDKALTALGVPPGAQIPAAMKMSFAGLALQTQTLHFRGIIFSWAISTHQYSRHCRSQ